MKLKGALKKKYGAAPKTEKRQQPEAGGGGGGGGGGAGKKSKTGKAASLKDTASAELARRVASPLVSSRLTHACHLLFNQYWNRLIWVILPG